MSPPSPQSAVCPDCGQRVLIAPTEWSTSTGVERVWLYDDHLTEAGAACASAGEVVTDDGEVISWVDDGSPVGVPGADNAGASNEPTTVETDPSSPPPAPHAPGGGEIPDVEFEARVIQIPEGGGPLLVVFALAPNTTFAGGVAAKQTLDALAAELSEQAQRPVRGLLIEGSADLAIYNDETLAQMSLIRVDVEQTPAVLRQMVADWLEQRAASERTPYDPNWPLSVLGLPTRAHNSLRRVGVETVGDLVGVSADYLLYEVQGFAAVSLAEVREALSAHGLHLAGDSNPIDDRWRAGYHAAVTAIRTLDEESATDATV